MAFVRYRRRRKQAEESVTRTLALDEPRRRYEGEYGGAAYTKHRLACSLFGQPYLTTKTVAKRFDVEPSTASRAIIALDEEAVLEEVIGKVWNKEY